MSDQLWEVRPELLKALDELKDEQLLKIGIYTSDYFDIPEDPPPDVVSPKPKCECGAAKVGFADYSPGHSTWCAVAEDEQTQRIYNGEP